MSILTLFFQHHGSWTKAPFQEHRLLSSPTVLSSLQLKASKESCYGKKLGHELSNVLDFHGILEDEVGERLPHSYTVSKETLVYYSM